MIHPVAVCEQTQRLEQLLLRVEAGEPLDSAIRAWLYERKRADARRAAQELVREVKQQFAVEVTVLGKWQPVAGGPELQLCNCQGAGQTSC